MASVVSVQGFLNVQVKKHMHERLEFHGAGKNFSKGVVERILHRMVFEGILKEDINKSDMFGSISSVLKVTTNSNPHKDLSLYVDQAYTCIMIIWFECSIGF